MLRAAILGALADEQALLVRLEPQVIRAPRDQVGLPGQARHPEAMADVRRLQCQVHRPRHAVLAGRYVQLVGRDDAQVLPVVLVVDVLPPPLVADDGHVERLRARRRRVRVDADFELGADQDQGQEEDDTRRISSKLRPVVIG